MNAPAERIKSNTLPNRVGGEKNAFGTRISRRVLCASCGKNDFISFVPGGTKEVYCKACAKDICKVYEVGEAISEATVEKKCDQCATDFKIPVSKEAILAAKETILCIDCLKGFDVWRGRLASTAASQTIIQRRVSGALLRRSQ